MMEENNLLKIDVDIVCPIYKGYKYLEDLYNSFYRQEKVNIKNIIFVVTNTNDDETKLIIDFIKERKIKYFIVTKDKFSHSLTREKAIREFCESRIVVMISQDIKLTNNMVFYNLVSEIDSSKAQYTYARQICTNKSIEKYIRTKNYPSESFYVTKNDIDKMQLMAFFASDACSAYDRDVFLKLNGYNGYDVMMNEDQLYSKFILDNGYVKKYCSDAIVEHSHKYTLKQLYKRYYDAGVFYGKVKLFDNYKSTNSGFKLALYVLKQALIHFDIPVLIRWLPDMFARYIGMKNGKKSGGIK